MSYGPFSPGHVITASEHNEFVAAHDAEVARATGAEATLAGRATSLEGFDVEISNRFPVGDTSIYYQFGAESLIPIGSAPSMLSTISDPLVIAHVTGGPASGQMYAVGLSSLQPGCHITSINVAIECSGYTSLPTTMPRFSLYAFNTSTGGAESVISGPTSDTTSSTAIFNTYHQFGGVVNLTTLTGYRYRLGVYMGTGGAGASAAILLKAVQIGMKG